MSIIDDVAGREILDSRGNPTVEVEVELVSGARGRAAVPSGASTGAHEAVELRDGKDRFGGKGVVDAVGHVNGEIRDTVVGTDAADQRALDAGLFALDGTDNCGRLGANAILGVSLAAAKAVAEECGLPLYRYVGGANAHVLPVPQMNVLNGGAHADSNVDIQEFMLLPVGRDELLRRPALGGRDVPRVARSAARSWALDRPRGRRRVRARPAVERRRAEAAARRDRGRGVRARYRDRARARRRRVGDIRRPARTRWRARSARSPARSSPTISPSCAARYPIVSIEDGMAEDDWDGWATLTGRLGADVQLVGDDVFVTNSERLGRGIDAGVANSILIKVNQIGSLTATLDTMQLAGRAAYSSVMSHRSGETEDATIADLAVATNCGQIKAGAPARSDRVAKYNQLLRIEEELGESAEYLGHACAQGHGARKEASGT